MKQFIKNRKNQNISVIIEKVENPKGLAFITHGLGDSKDSDHIKLFSKCFLDNNYNIIRFDTTNTFGESDGKFEDANITTYYEDLEDVLAWSKDQDFYQKPFILCGHSLGAICSAFYAENHPEDIKALAPFSTVVNVELSRKNYSIQELTDWEKKGFLIEDWGDFKVKIKWSYMQEKEKYDLLKKAYNLTMPVLLMVGELDDTTTPESQQILFDALPGKKELHIIKNAPHTFRDKDHLDEVYDILNNWIKKND
ncbi:MAG TPA: alpha/beta fold hydrolase [bacterium]|nr:alpha/beta fold hydrolase [bacterium]